MVTLVERRSRLSLIALAPNKTAKAVKAAILKVLQPLSAQVHTLTYDNGKEFAYHMEIAMPIPTIVTADSTDRDRCTHRVPTGVVFLR